MGKCGCAPSLNACPCVACCDRSVYCTGVSLCAPAQLKPVWRISPDRFDPSRRLDRHLGFGHGIHHCLGAALARLEARAGLACLLDRRPRYELCDSPVDWLDSGLVRGPRTLVATVT